MSCGPPNVSAAAATAQASAPAVSARSAPVVRPATSAPNPPGRAAGAAVAITTETRPVTSASTSAAAASGGRGTAASALAWMSSTKTSAPTPIGPMSGRRMMSSAAAAGRRLPSPSAVSASPSRCSPPVRTAITATASAAPSSRPGPVALNRAAVSRTPAPAPPASSPIAGSHKTARAATSSSSIPLTPAGIVVNRLTATRQAGGWRSLIVNPAPLAQSAGDARGAQPDLLGLGGHERVQPAELVAVAHARGGGGNDTRADLVADRHRHAPG